MAEPPTDPQELLEYLKQRDAADQKRRASTRSTTQGCGCLILLVGILFWPLLPLGLIILIIGLLLPKK